MTYFKQRHPSKKYENRKDNLKYVKSKKEIL